MKKKIFLLTILILALALPASAQMWGNASRLQNRPINPTAPTDTQVLCWDATPGEWKPCAAGGAASISDTAYAGSWDGVTDVAPSKNAVYDKIQTIATPALDDITNPDAAKTFTLLDNNASALSFGATGAADLLKISTLDAGPGVTIGGYLSTPATLTSLATVTWTLMDNQTAGLAIRADGANDIILVGTLDAGPSVSIGGTLALGTNNLTLTGSIGATGARATKVWTAALETTAYPTVNGAAVFDQDVSADANPSFSTINVVGTNSLNLGSAGSLVGQVTFKNATSGGITVQPITGALGTPTLVLGTTFTDAKWCSYATATGFTCNENAPAGSGDVTAATVNQTWGNGTGPVVWTYSVTDTDPVWTATNSSMDLTTGTLKQGGTAVSLAGHTHSYEGVLTNSAGLLSALNDETGTGLAVFNNSPTFVDDITLGSATPTGGSIILYGSTSGTITLQPAATAGTTVLTLPATTGTLAKTTDLPTAGSLHVDDILTALGIASEATHFGTFTGTTISDNVTAKAALQALETSLELKATLASPTFTGSVILPSANADPAATAGSLVHDSTVTNFTNGALRYYNGAAIKQLIDMTAATAEACTDTQVIAYNSTSDIWYCKDDANSGSATALNDIGDAAGDGTIAQTGYKQTFTSTLNAAGAVWTMTNTTADLTADVSFIDFKYTDDGDANGFFVRGYDNASDLKWYIGADGAAVFGSVTVSKVSGQAGTSLLYEETTTETNGVGWKGPASRASDLYLQFADADPAANQFMLFPAPTTGTSTAVWTTYGSFATAITPSTAGGQTVGSAALPFSSIYLGGAATNNFQITGTSAAARIVNIPDIAATGYIPLLSATTTTAGLVPLSTTTAGKETYSVGILSLGVDLTVQTGKVTLTGDGANTSGLVLPAGAITFAGPSVARTITLPDAAITVARTDAGQTFTGVQAFTAPTVTTSIAPAAADGATLGTSSYEFSDLYLADSGIIYFGNDQDVTLTHQADAGLLLAGAATRYLAVGDVATYINQPADGYIGLTGDTGIRLTAAAEDLQLTAGTNIINITSTTGVTDLVLYGATTADPLNFATTGTIRGGIKVIDMGSTAGTYTVLAADAYGSEFKQTHGDGATVVTLPDYQATAEVDHVKVGASMCFMTKTAYAMVVTAAADDKIRSSAGVLSGAAGTCTGPATVGAYACFVLDETSTDVGIWQQMGTNGAWVTSAP